MIGSGILFFGWFGFNAGSALAANGQAAEVAVTTLAATAAAVLGWLATEKIRDGHATSLGAASGVVAGLVAITPACSAVSPIGAILVGVIAGVVCALAVGLKYKLGYDDSLDVVGVHLVGGLWGTLAVGLFGTAAATAGIDGLFYGGGLSQLGKQAVGALAVLVYSFVLTLIIGFVISKVMRFRITEEEEVTGIDTTVHAESGYDLDSLGGGSGPTLRDQARAEARNIEGSRV
jgi:ammonium transporter, Amt family